MGRVICILRVCIKAFAFMGWGRRWQLCLCIRVGEQSANIPLRTLAGGAEVSISQPINSETKHIIRFQSFAEQITITTTILGDNKRTERNITFIGLESRGPGGNGPFHESLFWCLLSWRVCTEGRWLKKSVWLPAYT